MTILKFTKSVYKIDYNGREFIISKKESYDKDFREKFCCNKLNTAMTYIKDQELCE